MDHHMFSEEVYLDCSTGAVPGASPFRSGDTDFNRSKRPSPLLQEVQRFRLAEGEGGPGGCQG